MKYAAFVLLALLVSSVAAVSRQDEALDSMMLYEMQPGNEPLPRLLAEAIAGRAGAYGESGAGTYGGVQPETPGTIPTTVINPPAKATAGAVLTSSGVLSFMAAAAMAMAML